MNNTPLFINNLIDELNNQQKQAVTNPLNSCTKIVAGAGTGKTKIISKRFVKLVSDLMEENVENPSSKLLVITFTDKAANEMKERIINELSANGLNSFEENLWISTFHGFCSRLLRKHSIEVGLSPDFELADDSILEEIYQNILKTIKYNEYKSFNNIEKICKDLGIQNEILNVENIKKLSTIDDLDNVFDNIFAIIKKIKSLGLTPKEFLQKTINATEKFSQTVQTLPFKFDEAQDYEINWQSHLRAYIDDFYKFEFKDIINDKNILVKNNSKKASMWGYAPNYPENISQYTNLEIYLCKVIALIYALYQHMLETLNYVDFDDLINKTVYILKNKHIISAYYQKYFKHLIIDEFQDTNGAQLELIKLLLNPQEPNITFVGDRKQSIYGFRFAQMENLEVLHKYIEDKYNKKYPEIKLEINYRSSNHVLNAVNHTTTQSLMLDETLSPFEKNISKEENKYVKNTQITGITYANDMHQAEAKYIAHEITKLKEQENASYKDFAILVKSHSQSEKIGKTLTKAGIPFVKKTNKDFFTNPTIANATILLRLLKNPLDEIALTRLLKIKLSDKSLLNLKKEIDKTISINNINTPKKRPNLCEKIILLYETKKLLNPELTQIYDAISKAIKEKQQKTILQLFVSLEQVIPLYISKNQVEQFQNEINLRIFEKIISNYEENKNYTNITSFLDYLDKISQDRNFELPNVLSTDIDAVQILTIHASKGLEFPYVFVCGLRKEASKSDGRILLDLQYGIKPGFGLIVTKTNDKKSPKKSVYDEIWLKPRQQYESIRLFYVAISRAKKYLNIIQASKPAEYTKDFPSFVLLETVSAEEIPEIENNLQAENKPIQSFCLPKLEPQTITQTIDNYSFSFSKLNTYCSCAQKFLLKYKYNFPTIQQTSGTQVGSIVHKLINTSFLYKKEFTEEEIKNILKTCINDSNAIDKIILNYNIFKNSQYSVKNLQNQVTFTERAFKFTYKIADNEVEFNGDIDLLILNSDNTYTIVDFKTNKNLPASKYIYSQQLYLYKKAMEDEGLQVKSALLIGLNENNSCTIIELENENKIKEDFENNLQNAIECLNNNTVNNTDNDNCRFCEYQYICQNNN